MVVSLEFQHFWSSILWNDNPFLDPIQFPMQFYFLWLNKKIEIPNIFKMKTMPYLSLTNQQSKSNHLVVQLVSYQQNLRNQSWNHVSTLIQLVMNWSNKLVNLNVSIRLQKRLQSLPNNGKYFKKCWNSKYCVKEYLLESESGKCRHNSDEPFAS